MWLLAGFSLSYGIVWVPWSFACCWLECCQSALLHGPPHRRACNMTTDFSKANEHESKWRHWTFCNLFFRSDIQLLCCVLFIRRESLSSAYLRGRGSPKSVNTAQWESLGVVLEAFYHTCLRLFSESLKIRKQEFNVNPHFVISKLCGSRYSKEITFFSFKKYIVSFL